MEVADPTFIAVGLLSAGVSTAKSANSSIGVWRRSQLRTSFAQYTGGDVALRFLLAPSSLIPASDPTAVDVTPALLREANAHRDMIFLNMTEGLYRCASWWRERPLGSATARHPAWGCHSGSGRALLWSNCCAAQSPMRGQDVEPASTEAADCKHSTPGCTFKYLEWLRIGPTLFPRARFFVLGDDDIYLSFSHLQASRPSLPWLQAHVPNLQPHVPNL